MPATLLERLPLPSLRNYIGFSGLALGLAFYHAHRTVKEESTKLDIDVEHSSSENTQHIVGDLPPKLTHFTSRKEIDEHWEKMMYVMRSGTWNWLTLVNSHYCLLILIWNLMQKAIFGELRFIEKRNLQNTFWNFAFDKFIFIFGVLKMESLIEIVALVRWFSILAFLLLLTQLSKDRLEYLQYSVNVTWWAHVIVLTLLILIQVMCRDIYVDVLRMAWEKSFNIYTFKAVEILLVMLKSLYIIVRYVIQVQCMMLELLWDRRFRCLDTANTVFEPVIFTVDLAHHLHMLVKVLKDLILPEI